MENHLGCKFYKYDENNVPHIIRIKRIKNYNTYICTDEEGTRFKMFKEDLERDYVRLIPDGIITLSNVMLKNQNRDVVITLHRKKEIELRDDTPYVICRQSIFDFFTNMIMKTEQFHYIGVSVSLDTCPPDINFKDCAMCESIIDNQLIDIYIDDKFEDIISLLSTKKSDMILKQLAEKASPSVLGYTKSVRELLISTRFMYDFLKAFNIYPLNFEVEVFEDGTIPENQITELEDMLKFKINQILVVKYDKGINLSEIEHKYVLVSDIKENVYLVAYKRGEYLNRPYDNLPDHSERDKLIQMAKNRFYNNSNV